MHKFTCLLIIAAGVLLAHGCATHAPSPQAPEIAKPAESQATPSRVEATVRLDELRFGDRNDGQSRVLLIANPTYTGEGEIVGIAGRIEGYTLDDGTERKIVGPWRLFDSDELGYGRHSPVVQTCFLLHDRPWPDFRKITLRIRAAVAQRIERIEIDDFQPGIEQHAAAHGLKLTIQSSLGQALGRYDATFVYPKIVVEGRSQSADALSMWSLTPADRGAVEEASMWINYRTGFVDDEGLLIMPNGQETANGYHFLGQKYAGRRFGANVPVKIRIVDLVMDMEIP